jgi:hypothetical protein
VKKISALILAAFYLAMSVGATLQQHYCMGEFVGTSLFSFDDKECGKCGMKKHTEASKDCCKDVSIVVKTSDSHTFAAVTYNFQSFDDVTPPIAVFFPDLNIPLTETENTYRAHSPSLQQEALFLWFRNIRI